MPSSAGQAEIKTAFRKLAQQFHPDKNNNSRQAIAHFNLIKEAYENLTEPALREKYLQERWLAKNNGASFEDVFKTPETILASFIAASTHLSKLDHFRSHKESLSGQVMQLLNEEDIDILNEYHNLDINNEIIKMTIRSIGFLPFDAQLEILARLKMIEHSDEVDGLIIHQSKEIKTLRTWARIKPLLIFLALALVCTIIALSS